MSITNWTGSYLSRKARAALGSGKAAPPSDVQTIGDAAMKRLKTLTGDSAQEEGDDGEWRDDRDYAV